MTAQSNLFVFTDLDDSLFSSKRKHIKTAESQVTSINQHGEVESYSTVQQQQLLQLFTAAQATFIAVTGRKTSSFQNCVIDEVKSSKYAVVSHGALILGEKSTLLPCWLKYLNKTYNMVDWAEKLAKTHLQLTDYFTLLNCKARVRLIIDNGIYTYICIKIPAQFQQRSLLDKVSLYLNQLDFRIHANEGNFAVLPPYANKELAVNYLIHKLQISENDVVFGIGDSLLFSPNPAK
jgi:hydroxymethylpyrimidine pyrophosphatase-like HAD family hydrolase